MEAKLLKIDRNGTKYFEGQVACPRCDGKGIYYMGVCNGQLVPSWVDNGICFQCGGSGKVHGKWIERTPEYQAKLEAKWEAKRKAAQEAEEAERAAKAAEAEAKRIAEEAAQKAEEERIKAEKAISQFVGSVGDKIQMDVFFDHSAHWEQPSFGGYGMETMFLHCFRDSEGNLFIWKTTTNTMGTFINDGWVPFEQGKKLILKGTIKEHKEYKDEKQTVLTRCKVQGAE